jgi:hypothetical protein
MLTCGSATTLSYNSAHMINSPCPACALPTCTAARSLVAARRHANKPTYAGVRSCMWPASTCVHRGARGSPGGPPCGCIGHTCSTAPANSTSMWAGRICTDSGDAQIGALMPGSAGLRVFVTALALLSWLQRCAPCKPPGLTRLLGRAPRPATLRLLVLGRPGRARVRAALQVPPLHLRRASPALGTLSMPLLPCIIYIYIYIYIALSHAAQGPPSGKASMATLEAVCCMRHLAPAARMRTSRGHVTAPGVLGGRRAARGARLHVRPRQELRQSGAGERGGQRLPHDHDAPRKRLPQKSLGGFIGQP